MRAISLWQPHASLWLTVHKIHETRSWPFPHVGPLAVHAAKKLTDDLPPETLAIVERAFGKDWRTTLPCGALIGGVEIIGCKPTAEVYPPANAGPFPDDYWCGDFSPGRFAWERRRAFTLPKPREWRGRQNIFQVPDDLLPIMNWDGRATREPGEDG